MQQTKLESLVEKLTSIGIGFFVALGLWEWVIRPLVHAEYLSVEDSLVITLIFTVVSIIRGYAVRRFYNAGHHKRILAWITRSL